MKKYVVIFALVACALGAQAQGTFVFNVTLTGANEVPPNNDPTIGTGIFTLTGDLLTFRVDVPAVTFSATGGTINGPAGPGTNAPIIFDLGFFSFHPGSSQGDPPGYTWQSTNYILGASQINELQAGLWYVNITSFTEPAGQLRGQIFQVPEPSIVALIGSGATIWFLRKRRRPK